MTKDPKPEADVDSDWPKEIQLSKKVRAVVGFKDDRVQLYVTSPIPLLPDIPLSLGMEDVPRVEEVIKHARAWEKMPEFLREMMGKD